MAQLTHTHIQEDIYATQRCRHGFTILSPYTATQRNINWIHSFPNTFSLSRNTHYYHDFGKLALHDNPAETWSHRLVLTRCVGRQVSLGYKNMARHFYDTQRGSLEGVFFPYFKLMVGPPLAAASHPTVFVATHLPPDAG